MLRPLYDWLLRQAASERAPFVLAAHAFIEAICLPIPPDVMLAPMILMRPKRAWWYALLCMLASVSGGCAAYAIGYYLTPVGVHIIALTGHHVDLAEYRKLFNRWGILLILGKGFIPVPFLIVTIASGVAKFTLWKFIVACTISRGARFFLGAWLVKRYGPAVQHQVEKNLVLWGSLAVVLIAAVLIGAHFIFG
ncbi:MAG TPA: YqaA family protein [Caulobacteraceae bacterium]